MKTSLPRKISLFLILFTISSCGMGNNFALMGYNLSAISPNSHKVTKEIEDTFPQNGLAIVSLNFQSEDDYQDHRGVNTIWRKVNNDGTYGKRMTFTYIELLKRGRVKLALEPGTYYIDGIRFLKEYKKSHQLFEFSNGIFHKFYSDDQWGWDFDKKQAKWFSFTVKAGQELEIPDIFISHKCEDNSRNCTDDTAKLTMQIKSTENKTYNDYKIGYEVELEK